MYKGGPVARHTGCAAFSKRKQAFMQLHYRRGKRLYRFLVIKYKGIERRRLPHLGGY